MKRTLVVMALLAGVVSVLLPAGHAPSRETAVRIGTGVAAGAGFRQPPVAFEPNVGQADARILFTARTNGSAVSLTSSGAVLSIRSHRSSGLAEIATAIGMTFLGARATPAVVGVGMLPGVSNYYLGRDPSAWRTGVPQFRSVVYRAVYPGIDVRFYGNSHGRLEYDVHVAPGADPTSIRIGFDGIEHLSVDSSGDVVARSAGGARLVQPAPRVYQIDGGVRRPVAGGFALLGRSIRLSLAAFDRRLPLIIDPEIAYSTFVGGTGGDWDLQQTIAVDRLGEVYRCGGSDSIDFPVTAGAFQPHLAGSDDAVVFKLNRQGTALRYSTYIGGTGFDGAWGCTVDERSQLYMVGRSHSSDFPTTSGAFQRTFAGGDSSVCTEGFGGPPGPCDGVVAKFDRDGRLVYSSYLGGSGDDETSAVRVDARGNAYVSGITTSTDLPIPAGGYQPESGGGPDMYIAEVDPTGSRVTAGTYFGGSDYDGGDPALGLDRHGDVYAASSTVSADLPTTPGAYQRAYGGGLDAFVLKLNPSLSVLAYSTYLGAGGDEAPESNLTVDQRGNVYVDGATGSEDFPVTPGAYQPTKAGGYDAFVATVDRTGAALLYSSFLGGTGDDFGAGGAVDRLGRRYEMTFSTSMDFPTERPFQPANAGGFDMTVTQFSKDASGILFSTYLGGANDEFGATLALDPAGNLYADGCTQSSDFPVTGGAFQTAFRGGDDFGYCGPSDLFVTKIAFDGGDGAGPRVQRGPSTGAGMIPLPRVGERDSLRFIRWMERNAPQG